MIWLLDLEFWKVNQFPKSQQLTGVLYNNVLCHWLSATFTPWSFWVYFALRMVSAELARSRVWLLGIPGCDWHYGSDVSELSGLSTDNYLPSFGSTDLLLATTWCTAGSIDSGFSFQHQLLSNENETFRLIECVMILFAPRNALLFSTKQPLRKERLLMHKISFNSLISTLNWSHLSYFTATSEAWMP